MVIRRDITLEAIGTMASLPPDRTPLQIGASGSYGDWHFKLLGRLRVSWAAGTWNEWHADFGPRGLGWVAESQGIIYLLAEKSPPPQFAETDSPPPHFPFNGHHFHLADQKQTTVIAGEGELPFVAQPQTSWLSADYASSTREFASAEINAAGVRFYHGIVCHPREITWSGLAPVPGWNGEPAPVEKQATDSLPCPACGGVIERRAAGSSLTLVCVHCNTLVDDHGTHAETIAKLRKSELLSLPPIPLGKRGTLRGTEWEVIGAIRRTTPDASWAELLLFNPWQGFSWLTTWGGHWNFVQRILESPGNGTRIPYQGRIFKKYSDDSTKVAAVSGEFYWQVRIEEKSDVAEYIAPPFSLAQETYPGLKEITWSFAEYIDPAEISAAFAIPPAHRSTPFANQPNPWLRKTRRLPKYAAIATVLLIIIQIFSLGSSRQNVFQQSYAYRPNTPTTEIVTPSFQIKSGPRPAKLTLDTSVNNAWFGLNATLINEKSGKRHPANLTAERYSGYDGGHWTEGKSTASTVIPGIAPGRYHLAFTPAADSSITAMNYSVRLQHGGVFWSNFILSFIFIWTWPVFAIIRRTMFEAARWSESDYLP